MSENGAPPALEGRLHPLAALLVARRFLGASLLPALALLLSLGTRIVVPLLLAAVLVGIPLAILSWSRFRYRVAGGRLELHAGVVSRSVRIIPLERVRSVDVTRPFLHRLLGLAKVEVEAAAGGGKEAELALSAVSLADAAALREAILGERRAPGELVAAEPEPLYRATPGLLVLAGVTSMRYLLAPAAIVGVVFNLADDLPGGLVERAGDAVVDRFPTDALGVTMLALAAVAVVLAAAAAGSLLVDWDFTLRDEGERVAARRGLLTRRAVFLERERIRGVDLVDTLPRRALGLLSASAIAPGLQRGEKATLAPVLRAPRAAALVRAVDPSAPGPATSLAPHPPASLPRRLLRTLPAPLALLAAALALTVWWAVAAALALALVAAAVAVDRHRQLGHALAGGRLILREGSLRRRWTELDPAAVVGLELVSSPGQRRAGLCTLDVHLGQGAGSRRALDLGEGQAAALLPLLEPRLLAPLVRPEP
ncbi:MAG TPA: PH domain-containing protein [Gaiellaceae bacterium]|nr:PH domain-containing protein [Gaiellaceae bacterium]